MSRLLGVFEEMFTLCHVESSPLAKKRFTLGLIKTPGVELINSRVDIYTISWMNSD